jgi:DNA-3-methyladenine glycosylase
MKLERDFYTEDTLEVGKALLGKIIVSKIDGKCVKCRIVETECYIGPYDKAAHSYGGKRNGRCEIQFGEGGYAYIYMIYGMHCCFNIVTSTKDKPESVLIRAAEPLEGIDVIMERRKNEKIKNLLNGPGKLCQGLGIDRSFYGEDLCGEVLYLEDDGYKMGADDIEKSKRINIDYAEEAKDYLWRFTIKGNEFVSVKGK